MPIKLWTARVHHNLMGSNYHDRFIFEGFNLILETAANKRVKFNA